MSDTAKVETIESGFVAMVSLGSHCGFLADHAYRTDSSLRNTISYFLSPKYFYVIYESILQISESKLKPSYSSS